MPASLDDVAAIAEALPDVTVGEKHGRRTWLVSTKSFAWERPLTKADIKRWGDSSLPSDPIVAVSVDDLAEKEAVLAEGAKGVFDMAHFNGYPAVLIELGAVHQRTLQRLVTDAWLAQAPTKLAESYLASKRR